MDIRKIGVIGAGQMGNGIAHVCGRRRHRRRHGRRQQGRARRGAGHDRAEHVAPGQARQDQPRPTPRRRWRASRPPTDYAPFKECDIVIEAATENEQVKREILKKLCPQLRGDAIIATNTSSISITRLAASHRPAGEVHRHALHEPGAGDAAGRADPRPRDRRSDLQDGQGRWPRQLGKTVAVAEDFPAFIVNRILLPMINEAVYTLYEGVGSVEAIDTAMKLGANHPMGPLELADFIGLDTCLAVMQVLYEGLADSKYRPCPLLGEICRGRLARPQGRPRLLRLQRRTADPDALSPPLRPRARPD